MRIYVSQIYIEPGVAFPFKHRFQKFLSATLSDVVQVSPLFNERYGPDYDLMFRMSAKSCLAVPEIRGPTVFKRDRNVEFTVFLPFDSTTRLDTAALSKAVAELLRCIISILTDLGMNTTALRVESENIVRSVMEDASMIEGRDESDRAIGG
jgi:hypothetical protein